MRLYQKNRYGSIATIYNNIVKDNNSALALTLSAANGYALKIDHNNSTWHRMISWSIGRPSFGLSHATIRMEAVYAGMANDNRRVAFGLHMEEGFFMGFAFRWATNNYARGWQVDWHTGGGTATWNEGADGPTFTVLSGMNVFVIEYDFSYNLVSDGTFRKTFVMRLFVNGTFIQQYDGEYFDARIKEFMVQGVGLAVRSVVSLDNYWLIQAIDYYELIEPDLRNR